jgi:hypothetical protein
MIIMNNLKYIAPLLLFFTIISCSDKSTPTSPGEQDNSNSIAISDTLVKFSSDSSSSSVQITSNTNWSITVQESWLRISPNSGKEDGTIKITAKANNNIDKRESTLKVKASTKEKIIHVIQKGVDIDTSQSIKINQEGSYLDITGAKAIMVVDSNTTFNFSAGQSFSISLKVKMNEAPNDGRLLGRRNTFKTGYGIFVHGDGRVGMNVRDDNNTNFGSNFGTTNVADGKWHHITGVFNTNKKKTYLYIDGNYEGERSFPGTPTSITKGGKVVFGAMTTDGVFKFEGLLDDVHFWSKALTKEEIYADAANVTLSSDADDLVAGWNFEKVNGKEVPDITGNFIGNLMNGADLSK